MMRSVLGRGKHNSGKLQMAGVTPFPRGLVVLAGHSHPQLAEQVARRAGVTLGKVMISKESDQGSFPDFVLYCTKAGEEPGNEAILLYNWKRWSSDLSTAGICFVSFYLETQVEIKESIRGKDIYIIQTGGGESVNDTIMEMLIMCYACKTASARKIIGVIPFLPYCRQSKMRKRGCIAAKLLASMLAKAGMSHLITMDLYRKEIQGFFDFPVDNLRGSPFLIQYIREHIPDYRNAVIVARYPGVTRRANAYAEVLHLGLAVIHGEPKDMDSDEGVDGRTSPPPEASCPPPTTTPTKAEMLVLKEKPPLNVVGDVHGRIAIIVDDIIDDVDRVIAAANCVKERGAYRIYAVATHGLFSSEDAPQKLEKSPINEVLVTNTVLHDSEKSQCSKIKTIDISLMLAEAVRRIYHGESMSQLFRNIPMED